MFYLPAPIYSVGDSVETGINRRSSRGYNYNFLLYSWNVDNKSESEEPYTILTDEGQTKVFAYMPPRRTVSSHPEEDSTEELEVQESVEGTMVTFFWNPDVEGGKWEVCSRNGVGCDYSFVRATGEDDHRPKTFRQMILDVFRIKNRFAEPHEIKDLDDIAELNTLNKDYCYTCILQHPDNHIVYPHAPFGALLKLIAIYETFALPPLVSENSEVRYNACVRSLHEYRRTEERDDEVWESALNVFTHSNTVLKYQSISEINAFIKETRERFDAFMRPHFSSKIHSSDISETPDSIYYPPAWIITNPTTGHRQEFVNPFYEFAKSLRCMQPNLRYQFLLLRKTTSIRDYLTAFPTYRAKFEQFEQEYREFITEVHRAYVNFYILKQREQQIPKKYFIHAARIHHNIYLQEHRKINYAVVNEYFDQFSHSKMFYFLGQK